MMGLELLDAIIVISCAITGTFVGLVVINQLVLLRKRIIHQIFKYEIYVHEDKYEKFKEIVQIVNYWKYTKQPIYENEEYLGKQYIQGYTFKFMNEKDRLWCAMKI